MPELHSVLLTSKRSLRTLYYNLPISTILAKSVLQKRTPPYKLNFGCGMAPIEGWINIDVSFSAKTDVRWDLRRPFPHEAESCSRIYSESLFELFTPDDGIAFLRDCHRLLAPGGIARMAMPALEDVVSLYISGEWKQFDSTKPGYKHYQTVQNGAQLMNAAFRHPDHRWIYDWEDLNRVVEQAGFARITRAEWGQSTHPEFRNLETRPESKLICEIQK
jgi:predicted SAM-dependent methyltransferase